jgi:hypothetical protein
MTREALAAVSAGLTSAIATVAFLSGSFLALVLVYLAPLPMLLAGLSYGPRAAAIAALAGTTAMGFFGGWLTAGVFALIHAGPTWMVVKLALMARTGAVGANGSGTLLWMDPGQVISVMAAFAAGLLVLAALAVGDVGLSGYVAEHLGLVLGQMAPEVEATNRTRFASAMTPLFPGAVSTSWLVMLAVNAAIAQGLLVRFGRNRRPSPNYAGLELPGWLSWPLVGAAALALAGSGEWEYMGRNLAMVLALPYFFLGLAVFHTLARRVSATKPLLVAFYLVIVISVWAALVVAGIGVVEQWFGLRGRIAPPGPQNGPTGRPEED